MLLVDERRDVALKAKLFRGFADGSRLAILESLRERPRTVNEICRETALGQSNASNHLGCLRECGLVRRTRRGRFVEYELADAEIAAVLGSADRLLAGIARGIACCAKYGCDERDLDATDRP